MPAKVAVNKNFAKHDLVASVLRKEITEDGIAPGSRLPSEAELCDRFKSSRGPVRQALAALESEGLIYRVQGAGSFVAERPQGEGRHGRHWKKITVVLGFAHNMVSDGVGAELIDGLNRARRDIAPRAQLSFEFGFDYLERFLNASPVQIQSEADGLIVVPVNPDNIRLTRMLVSRKIPVVSCFRKVDDVDIAQVFVDQDEGSIRGTEYLLRYGHRRIALLTAMGDDNEPRYDSIHRINGYKSAFASMGVPVDESMFLESTLSMDTVMIAVTEMLSRPVGKRPTALMVGGIRLLPPTIMAIHRLGIRIPEDLSLLAFDDSAHAQFHSPALTVVNQCADKAARIALRHLLESVGGELPGNEQIAVKPELIIRDSCAPYTGK